MAIESPFYPIFTEKLARAAQIELVSEVEGGDFTV